MPNPNLGPLEKAPFYAIPVYPGDIGTNGGLQTNENAQVHDECHEPIPGLYAVGNTSASVMGHFYPGAGGTLGPAMTFGYVAARHATNENLH
jgi:3-oxosteroid 1-dehydrogenase